ncbi:MAG: hypothetical protein NC489_26740 [Ruminococcus flavefaciens]|nr:hypothetical protein [Ruminococcus flavefaciens]
MMGIEGKKGLELPLIPGRIGQRVCEKAEAVIKGHPDEMKRVYQLIQFIFQVLDTEGMLALEDAVRQFDDIGAPFADFLPDYIIALVDGTESDLLAEMMANEFEVRRPDDFEALVLYLYMLTVLEAQIINRSVFILWREQALAAWSRMRNECLPDLPMDCLILFSEEWL